MITSDYMYIRFISSRKRQHLNNHRLLLTILERLRNGEREVFTVNTLFNSEAVLHESSIKLEVFIYRVIENHSLFVPSCKCL
jgi:hypothetical protein